MLLESHCNDPEMLSFVGLDTAGLHVASPYSSESALAALRALHQPLLKLSLPWPASGCGTANLVWISERLGLSPVQRQVLALCALARLCTPLQRALQNLGTLDDLRLATVLSMLLDCTAEEAGEALSPASGLRLSGLLRMRPQSEVGFAAKVGLMNGLAERLFSTVHQGIELFEAGFSRGPAATVPLEGFAHLQPQLNYAVSYLRECIASSRPGANVLIRGLRGTGKTALAHALALAACSAQAPSDVSATGGENSRDEGGPHAAGFYVVAHSDVHGPLSSAQRLSAYVTAQHVLPRHARAIIVFDDIEDLDQAIARDEEEASSHGKQDLRSRQVELMLQTNPIPAIWVSSRIRHLDETLLRRFALHLQLKETPAAQLRILKSYATPLGATNAWCERRASDASISPSMIAHCTGVASAVLRQQPEALPEVVMDSLIESTIRAVDGEHRHQRGVESAVDYDPALISTEVDVAMLLENLRTSPSARMCFYGPPGTGKSALARYIAEALGRPALIRRSSDLIGSFVGESERAVAQAFEDARHDGAVLILDEIDSLLGNRESAVRSWEVSLVNELLQQIEAFEPGLFVATTNALDRIDEATMRRFDLKLEFRFLQPDQAGELMRRSCERLGLYAPGCEELAADIPRLTPGDFATVIRQSRLRPVRSAQEMASRLKVEVGYKRGQRQAIGFRPLSN